MSTSPSKSIGSPPAPRRDDELVLEGIVTTVNADGSVNISPMGPVVDRSMKSIRLRPYQSSTTYQNLLRNPVGVFHVTDDVELLVRAAVGQLDNKPEVCPVDGMSASHLADVCRWYAFRVESLDDSKERIEIHCTVSKVGRIRDFVGWNRAMHCVLEAAILATRVRFLSQKEVNSQMRPWEQIVQKCASDKERRAWDWIERYIHSCYETNASSEIQAD